MHKFCYEITRFRRQCWRRLVRMRGLGLRGFQHHHKVGREHAHATLAAPLPPTLLYLQNETRFINYSLDIRQYTKIFSAFQQRSSLCSILHSKIYPWKPKQLKIMTLAKNSVIRNYCHWEIILYLLFNSFISYN